MTELYEGRRRARRLRLPALVNPAVAVAIAALGAGVGIATVTAPPVVAARPANPHDEAWVPGISQRMFEATFNPRVQRGMKVAKVAFLFRYEFRTKDRDVVRERIDATWTEATSRILRLLLRHSPEELKSDTGLDVIERELRAALDGVMFADGIARTQSIQWQQVVVQ